MIIATLGFNCLKNVLMLGKKREGVGNSVACTRRRVSSDGLCETDQELVGSQGGTFSGKLWRKTAHAALLAVTTT